MLRRCDRVGVEDAPEEVLLAPGQVGLGLLLGLAGTIVWASVFPDTGREAPQLFDPAVFATICVMLSVVTLGACVIPLRRATTLDPSTTLREP